MPPREQIAERAVFGSFEINLATGEVFKNGRKLRLSGQPAQVLVILLRRAGELVRREELRELLWREETFVDFDHGLNNCINRIREVLGDSAASPEWIETLPKQGYRFIAPVHPQETIAENQTHDAGPFSAGSGTSPGKESSPIDLGSMGVFWTRRRRWLFAMCVVAVASSAAIGFSLLGRKSGVDVAMQKIQAVAVLPFTNLSGDSSQEYLTDGITDEVITALAGDTAVPVISRTSVMRYKNGQVALPVVARELGVDAVVESSLQRTGDHFTISTNLIAANSDTHLWASRYESDRKGLPQMVARMASDLAGRLGEPAGDRTIRAAVPAVSAEAYDEYLRGQFLWNLWQAQAALRHFQRAAELEPNFAAAHAGVAKSYCHLEYERVLPASAAYPKVSAAAEKALALDPHDADAHAALSYLYTQRDWDFERAEQELKTTIVDGPGNSIGHRWYRYILHMKGRKEEALEQARLAMKTDPASVTLVLQYGLELANCKRYEEAISAFHDALEFDPNNDNTRFALADAYKKAGKVDLAAAELEQAYRVSGKSDIADQFQKELKRAGFRQAADAAKGTDFERQLRELNKKSARREYVSPTAYAYTYAGLHDKENTLKWLEAAYVADAHVLVELREEPFEFVRQEPRFKKVWDNVPFLH